MKKTIVFCDNMLSSLIIFRGNIIAHFIAQGYRVIALVPQDDKFKREIPQGLELIYQPLTRSSVNIWRDKLFLKELKRIISAKPDHVFSYTIKPNIYCAWLCKRYGVSLTAMVPGLGYVSNSSSLTAKLGKWLYKVSLKQCSSILILNQFNRDILINEFKLKENNVKLLRGGEGLDLDEFKTEYFPKEEKVSFLMIGRVLADKGYREYVEAARLVKEQYPEIKFKLLGFIDLENPEGIKKEEIDKDVQSGVIEYLGYVNDTKPSVENSACIVLPSYYYEGLNRSLMEACAMGRIVIATNIPGCKETVDEGVNGFLVVPKDANDLAEAMLKVIRMSLEERLTMSLASRKKAEGEFGMDKVYTVYDEELKHK